MTTGISGVQSSSKVAIKNELSKTLRLTLLFFTKIGTQCQLYTYIGLVPFINEEVIVVYSSRYMYVHEVVIDIQQQTATDIVVYIRS